MSLSGVQKMAQNDPKYPTNGAIVVRYTPVTDENIERIGLALNFFSDLLVDWLTRRAWRHWFKRSASDHG